MRVLETAACRSRPPPRRPSRVALANDPHCPFPIENLPYGVFSIGDTAPRAGVAIGDQILDLSVVEAGGALRPGRAHAVFNRPDINAFMALGASVWRATRAGLSTSLRQNLSCRPPLRHSCRAHSFPRARHVCICRLPWPDIPTSMPQRNTRRMLDRCFVIPKMP